MNNKRGLSQQSILIILIFLAILSLAFISYLVIDIIKKTSLDAGAGKVCQNGICDFNSTQNLYNCIDSDNDSFNSTSGCGLLDCNDNNNLVYPGTTEICDNLDNDCNGEIDEGLNCFIFITDFSQPSHDFKGMGWNINTIHFNGWTDNRIRDLLDSSNIQFARVLGWSTSWYAPVENSGRSYYESSEMQGLYGFLQYAKDNDVTIQLANFHTGGIYLSDSISGTNFWTCQNSAVWPVTNCWPDQYFWLSEISRNDPSNTGNKFCHKTYTGDPGFCSSVDKTNRNLVKGVESDHPYSDSVFVNILIDQIKYLVINKKYDIDFVSLWNEPHGDWSYHPRDSNKKYPSSFRNLYLEMKNELRNNPSLNNIKLIGFDGEFLDTEFNIVNPNIDAIGIHHYPLETTDPFVNQVKSARSVSSKKIIIGEIGDQRTLSCGQELSGVSWNQLSQTRKIEKVFQNSIISTNNSFTDINNGAYAVARWEYIGDSCWSATDPNGLIINEISKYNFNSVKILSQSIPRVDYDFRIVETINNKNSLLNVVSIDFSKAGENPKLAIWIINPTNQPQQLNYFVRGFSGIKTLKKSLYDDFGEITYFSDLVQLAPDNLLRDNISANSIVVYTEYSFENSQDVLLSPEQSGRNNKIFKNLRDLFKKIFFFLN